MRIEFNPTGTHVHKDFLNIRLDFYPDPTDKTYAIHHIQVPVIPQDGYTGEVKLVALEDGGFPFDEHVIVLEWRQAQAVVPASMEDYDAWFDGLPRVWQTNPCLCHFVVIEESTTLRGLEDFIADAFDKDTIASLDTYLAKPKTNPLLSSLLRYRSKLAHKRVLTKNTDELISAANTRFGGVEINSGN